MFLTNETYIKYMKIINGDKFLQKCLNLFDSDIYRIESVEISLWKRLI